MKKKAVVPAKKVTRTKLVVEDRKIIATTFQIYEDQKKALTKRSKLVVDGKRTSMQGVLRDLLDENKLCNPKFINNEHK
jgi:hypothetical protein